MTAFLFTLALLIFFGLVGFAVASFFQISLHPVQNVLISPALGIAAIILPVFFINRLGIPVKDFASILLILLFALSIAVLFIKRPFFPLHELMPFFGIFLAGIAFLASPMFSYGFDWISFANDDMANYALGAQRFLNYGFFDKPDLDSLSSGRDYSQAYWFLHVADGVRPGSELMLATIWGALKLNAHQIFMPLIMALYLSLISAATAMVAASEYARKTTYMAALFLACSPLIALGAFYQLIGQVGGIALLCAAVTLIYRPYSIKPYTQLLIKNIPSIAVISALFIWYPELLSFFGLGWFLYLVLVLKDKTYPIIKIIVPALLIGISTLIFLNKYVVTTFLFVLEEVTRATLSDTSAVLFPYFLVPSGIPALWGLIPIFKSISEPFLSAYIALGILFSIGFVFSLWKEKFYQTKELSSILIVILLSGIILFFKKSDFILFKLAMYIQPFILCVLAVLISKINFNSLFRKIIFCLFIFLCLRSEYSYIQDSKYSSEIGGGSEIKIYKQLEKIFRQNGKLNRNILCSDTAHPVLAKYIALYSRGTEICFSGRDFFWRFIPNVNRDRYDESIHDVISESIARRDQHMIEHTIDLPSTSMRFFTFKVDDSKMRREALLITQKNDNILNKAILNQYPEDNGSIILRNPKNMLMFVHSSPGYHYYLLGERGRDKIAYFRLEQDPMFPGRFMSGMGRYLLLKVSEITAHTRLVMELTDTVLKQDQSALPQPNINSYSMKFVGRGSGRVVSELLEPIWVDNEAYIAIDMGRNGKLFSLNKKGLMKIYGSEISLDPRWLTTFGREISLISEEDYQAFKAPEALSHFPQDLNAHDLEYSGIYEDGWISERAFFILEQNRSSKFFIVRGMVPNFGNDNFKTKLSIQIDSKNIIDRVLVPGSFEIKIPVVAQDRKQRIDLSFSDYQVLPAPDSRPTGAKIDFIGYVNGEGR